MPDIEPDHIPGGRFGKNSSEGGVKFFNTKKTAKCVVNG